MRSRVVALLFGVAAGVLAVAPACADHEPTYVVPGRSDVAVMINGVDASWGVIEGDWGLYRPGHGSVTVIPAPYTAPPPPPARRYYPSLGGLPYSGRLEIEPPANRQLPPAAPSYHRSWSSSSDPLPASEPVQLPPILMAPITVPVPAPTP